MILKNNEKTNSHQPEVMENLDVGGLADRCLNLLREKAPDNCHNFDCYRQVFICCAGTPGSGKSFIAEQVRDRINERNPNGDPDEPECVVLPMDGYHLTRKQLKEKSGEIVESDQFSEDLNTVESRRMTYNDLIGRRGAPFTYNMKGFIRDLLALKEKGEGSFPIYDRSKHDPVPNGVNITKGNKIIIVEGLYLLCLDDPDWGEFAQYWDDKWYVEVSLEETKQRLVKRHLKNWNEEQAKRWGGDGEEAAARKAEANDMLNARCIMKHSEGYASLIIKNETIPGSENDSDKKNKERKGNHQ